jgi:hypothetical protein
MIICQKCEKEILNKQNKFCSRSCAATFNNKLRSPRTRDSRIKTAKSLIKSGNFSAFPELRPNIIVQKISKHGGLNFCRYEEKIKPELEKIYGELFRENINGIAIDFSNTQFLIEFTVDHTAGVSKIINRFSNINDNRVKIAYVPFKIGLGRKRLSKLKELNVEVFDSLVFDQIINKYKQSKFE